MVGTSVDFGAVLKLCSNEHRRIVLTVLAAGDGPVSLTDLAETVARQRRQPDGADVSGETTQRVETSLHHEHLPALESAGLVEYDAATRRVERAPGFEAVESQLTTILEADPALGPTMTP